MNNPLTLTYQVRQEPGGGFHVECLDWPDLCYTCAESMAEVVPMAAEVTGMAFASLLAGEVSDKQAMRWQHRPRLGKGQFRLVFDPGAGRIVGHPAEVLNGF